MTEKSFRIREKRFRSGCVVALGLISFASFPPARAQWAVYDGANHVQSILIAARELQQIDNQITSLANQAQMLVNQGRNLATLPLSTLSTLQSTVSAVLLIRLVRHV